jgi:hypothetical protein
MRKIEKTGEANHSRRSDQRPGRYKALGLIAACFLGGVMIATPARADDANLPGSGGVQCRSRGHEGQSDNRAATQASHWHFALRYLQFPRGSGFSPYFYLAQRDECDLPEQSRAYYCANPAGYYPNVAQCRVEWLTIYLDPEPVEPVPAG